MMATQDMKAANDSSAGKVEGLDVMHVDGMRIAATHTNVTARVSGMAPQQGKEVLELTIDAKHAPKIGVDKIVVTAPDTFVPNEVLDVVTNSSLGKTRDGIGVNKARLPTYSQGNVTLAANSIYEFIKNVSGSKEDSAKFFTEPINAIYYATESNDDFSRPEAVIALAMATSRLLNENEDKYRPYVEMLRHIELKQVTFACAGAGLSMSNALESILAAYTFSRNESALIITTDTAVYDSVRAPNAEATQGAAATLYWITKNPRLLNIDYSIGYGKFTIQFPDFTKFGNHNPKVYGKFSEIGYVYAVAEALEDLEARYASYSGSDLIAKIDAFVGHVPFPKQAIYFAGFLFEHYLKTYNRELFEELQSRPDIGQSPIDGKKFTDIMREKLRAFNGKDKDIIAYIANDKEINAYWSWLKRLRDAPDLSDPNRKRSVPRPEFEAFIKGLNIRNALVLPSEVGNAYASSTHVALASELLHGNGTNFILAYYGSGLIAKAFYAELAATSRKMIEDNVIVTFGAQDIALDAAQYAEVHSNLLKGDARRMMETENSDLIEKDVRLLRLEDPGRLPKGFYLRKRNDDGTWEGAYSDGSNMAEIRSRY